MTYNDNIFDYIIIGSGIAGLSAALECSKHGKTAIITKSHFNESATLYAQGGIAVALKDTDTPEYHYNDTIQAGDGLCNKEAVKKLVEDGPKRVEELIKQGANFNKKNNKLDFTKEAAHCKRRILHVGDATGREIHKTLGTSVLNSSNITIFSHTFVHSLITNNKECLGCIATNKKTVLRFFAKATLIATGGAGHVYSHTTNPTVSTGDGIALGYNSGCTLQDMEFVQFHPTTLAIGDKKPISIFLISEAVRGEGAVLRNIHGERFMPDIHPDAEMAPRDIVARAIYLESQRTKNAIFLDLSPIQKELFERFPTITKRCKEAGIDINKEFIPVSPAAHYFMGGIQTNIKSQTNILRLYAAGEVASLGLHGANRLASNSLLDGLVFGHSAAENMCKESTIRYPQLLTPISLSDELTHSHTILSVRQRIRTIMWRNVSIIREEKELKAAKEELNKLKWLFEISSFEESICEAKNMLQTSLCITESALLRKESRGAHFRKDFPEKTNSPIHTSLSKKRSSLLTQI